MDLLKLNFNILFIIIILIKLNSTGNININSADILKNSTNRIGKNLKPLQPSVEQCTTQTGHTGLCMKRTDCTRNSGIVSGYCGTFGVCCELNLKCSGTSKLKTTIIRNPEILPRRCVYHFQAYSSSVCQLRVDFDVVLTQPTILDNNDLSIIQCIDKFEIGKMIICGKNIKQHVYLNFDIANGFTDAILSFVLSDRQQNSNIQESYWNLMVTQLECPSVFRSKENTLSNYKMLLKQPTGDLELLAPHGCSQYFHEPQGIIESFNYNDGNGPYLGNMHYGICFKRTTEDLGIQFSGTVFEIGALTDTNDFIDSDCRNRIINAPNTISNDYLEIPESVLATTPNGLLGTFYCGNSLQGKELLHAPPGPFAIYFNSDHLFSTKYQEIGFKIKYIMVKL